MKKILLLLLILVNVLVLTSCAEENNSNNNNNDNNNSADTNTPSVDNKTEHTHTYTTLKSDQSNHWYVCDCGEIGDKEAHDSSVFESEEVSVCSCGAAVTDNGFYPNITSIGVDPTEVHNAYQVLLYSFYDSDGDGYGDLAGLEEKLPYIQELGCDLIWLSPIMESESYHSYDITSFYQIEDKLGTLDDYLSLVNTAHEMDMKILLDMPINHTSINHEWFIEYLEGGNEFYQEYDSSYAYGEGVSSMGDKAKFYTDATSGKTYFAAFGATMPDLNYNSEVLVEAIEEVFDYWTYLGADGYRFDAVKHVYDAAEIPVSYNQVPSKSNWDSYKDYFNQLSVDKNNELFQRLGERIKGINSAVLLLGENFSGQGEVKLYAESFDAEFDFDSWQKGLGAVTLQNKWGGNDGRIYYDDTVVCNTNELIDINSNWIATWMTGNHDVDRAASYICDIVADDDAALKLYAAMVSLRSGIPFIYYGDEVGQYGQNKSGDGFVEDSQIRLPMNFADSTVTLESVFYTKLDSGKYLYENMLQDWAGFRETNPVVEDQIDDSNSLYNTYRELLQYRKDNPAIALGYMEQFCDLGGAGTIISFEYDGMYYYVAFNFSETEMTITDLCLDGSLYVDYFVNYAETDGNTLYLDARSVAVFTCDTIEYPEFEEVFDANYGLVITHNDGSETIVKLKPWDEFEGFSQHFGDNVKLEAGDVITLIDFKNGNARWAEDTLSKYGQYQNFTTGSNGITCNVSGTYDFYVKFKWEADEIYIGNENGA